MMKGELALFADQGASILPAGGQWNEVGWCRDLDVEVQLLLESGYLPKKLVAVRDQLDVHVDRCRPPAFEDGRCTSGEVDAPLGPGDLSELSHEPLDASRVG